MSGAGATILMTGATAGIGRAAAMELARRGARLTIAVRNERRGREALEAIAAATGNKNLELLVGDLSLMAGVRAVAAAFKERHDRLDVLINNAGGVFSPRQVTAEGYELTFALDHLAYFLLTNELLGLLKAAAPSRVVSTSSIVARRGCIDFDDLQGERCYRPWHAYSSAKFANVLFTVELARRLDGSGVTANCVHPGFVRSSFGSGLDPISRIGVRIGQIGARSAKKGAKGLVYLATSPDVAGVSGGYFFDEKRAATPKAACDEALARRLWDVSELLTAPGSASG